MSLNIRGESSSDVLKGLASADTDAQGDMSATSTQFALFEVIGGASSDGHSSISLYNASGTLITSVTNTLKTAEKSSLKLFAEAGSTAIRAGGTRMTEVWDVKDSDFANGGRAELNFSGSLDSVVCKLSYNSGDIVVKNISGAGKGTIVIPFQDTPR